jgi:hypothetical protein
MADLCPNHNDCGGYSWLDKRGECIDPDDGMCEDCYATWLEGLKADRRALSLQRQQNEALRSDNNMLSAQLTAARGLLAQFHGSFEAEATAEAVSG